MSIGRVAFVCVSLMLAGCAGKSPPESAAAVTDWRRVATADDRDRIGKWRTAFTTALGKARAAGHAGEIAREGRLLAPDAAEGDAAGIPAGAYRCRVIKLGAKSQGLLDYIAYPAFDCRVSDEGEVSSFTKISGSQRPVGLIFRTDGSRQIFLGTLMLGDEREALDYGRDATRDMAGVVEKIGPRRWRMLLPYPRFESLTDVVELVPAG